MHETNPPITVRHAGVGWCHYKISVCHAGVGWCHYKISVMSPFLPIGEGPGGGGEYFAGTHVT